MPPRRKQTRKSLNKLEVIEERTFVNPSAISPHLFCPICQEIFTRPMRANCGHSYCETCIKLWLQTNPVCPIDRKPVTVNSLHHDFIVESIIGDYTIACPWRSLGCDFIGPLHSLPTHRKECLVNPDTMPPALRQRSNQLLESMQSTLNNRPVVSAQSASTSQSEVNTENSIIIVSEDEEANLPPAPPPNLLFRLYHNSDSPSRDLLCNFVGSLSSSSVMPPSPLAKRSRRRTGRTTKG